MNLRREVVSQDGYRISYVVCGDGPTIVMLPGELQAVRDWEEVGYVDRFCGSNRVIAIDPLGHGESEKPTDPEAYAPEAVAERMAEVLDHEEVERAVLWGYGRGAAVAVLIARRRPDTAEAVVCGGMYLGDPTERLRQGVVDPLRALKHAADALDHGDWKPYFELGPGVIPADLREVYTAENDARVVAAITRAELRWHRSFLKPSAPTFVYWASGDSFAAENARLAETMAVGSAVIPGSHQEGFLLVERVATDVERFLLSRVRA